MPKEKVVISTKNHKPDVLTYFKAGRYIGETYPNAGACTIEEDRDETGYILRISVSTERKITK